MTCCFETYRTYIFEGLSDQQYDDVGELLSEIGFSPEQIFALVGEAKYFGILKITNVTDDNSEILIEGLDDKKISYKQMIM